MEAINNKIIASIDNTLILGRTRDPKQRKLLLQKTFFRKESRQRSNFRSRGIQIKIKNQLTFADNIYGTPLQVFHTTISQGEKEEAANDAIDKAIEKRVTQSKVAAENKLNRDYSSSDSNEYYPGASSCQSNHDEFTLTNSQKQLLLELKYCLPLTTGFDIEDPMNKKHCHCPCGQEMKKWRKDANLDVEMLFDDMDRNPCCVFKPTGLMQHLKVMGEGCILHYGTRMYLEKLYPETILPQIKRLPTSHNTCICSS